MDIASSLAPKVLTYYDSVPSLVRQKFLETIHMKLLKKTAQEKKNNSVVLCLSDGFTN